MPIQFTYLAESNIRHSSDLEESFGQSFHIIINPFRPILAATTEHKEKGTKSIYRVAPKRVIHQGAAKL